VLLVGLVKNTGGSKSAMNAITVIGARMMIHGFLLPQRVEKRSEIQPIKNCEAAIDKYPNAIATPTRNVFN
jgi:hypothetical protein